MQTFGPVGEPGDGPQQAAATSSANASGEPVYFTMRTTGEVVKVSADGDNKSAARVDGMPAEAGWQGIQVGNELFQV